MASPRRERLKQELREEILAAARNLFVTDGYGSVSMRKIAETVGCAPGTLYLHFKDKAAILNAICVETFTRLDKRMEAIANDKGEPLDKLRRGGRAYIQFGLDHPHHYWLTFGLHENEWSKEEQTKVAGMHSFGCLQTCIRGCVEAGKLRSNDVEEIAQAVWSSAHGVIMLLIAKPEFAFVEQTRLIDRVLDITIEGIRKR
jgi:AcrR family transcriptional regulator